MKQIIEDYGTGEVRVEEVPAPASRRGRVVVATRASIVSPGTERQIVNFGRASLAQKAKHRPDLVRQVLAKARSDGFVATWRAARTRLQDWLALGYSCSGVVLDVGEGVTRFRPGDRVACAGQNYASHAQVVSVPVNLVAPIPASVSFEDGAFATLGAIALHGIHRAQVAPGDRVAVIGLGLLGQLAVQILAAYGSPVLGIDVRPEAVAKARQLGASHGAVSGQDDVEAVAAAFTGGVGVDAVVITAATASSEPLQTGARIARKRGRICVVGLVGMEADRQIFYAKELDLVVAKSYGPGRDDPTYEQKGIDYPLELSRWSIARNMEEFLRLVAQGCIPLSPHVSQGIPLAEAPAAYDRLVEGGIGGGSILIEYPAETTRDTEIAVGTPGGAGTAPEVVQRAAAVPRVAFLGAGSFSRGTLLPALAKAGPVDLRVVVAGSPPHAAQAARKFGFARAGTDLGSAISQADVDTVFIATRHDLHASLAAEALRAGKHVFVEKPMGLHRGEIQTVAQAATTSAGLFQVGFNRRFSPQMRKLRAHFAGRAQPLLMTYRVNAGSVDPAHWTRDSQAGGGRILGEVCHFVDSLQFIAGAPPVRVWASGGTDAIPADDHLVATIEFQDGSRGVIVYTGTGPSGLPKERLEVVGAGRSAVLDNFRVLDLRQGAVLKRDRALVQDKGHAAEIAAFLDAVRSGGPPPVPLEDLVAVSLATLAIAESLEERRPIDLDHRGVCSVE